MADGQGRARSGSRGARSEVCPALSSPQYSGRGRGRGGFRLRRYRGHSGRSTCRRIPPACIGRGGRTRWRGGGHSHALAWQAAGWRTRDVDLTAGQILEAETLVFERAGDASGGAAFPPPRRKFDLDRDFPAVRHGSLAKGLHGEPGADLRRYGTFDGRTPGRFQRRPLIGMFVDTNCLRFGPKHAGSRLCVRPGGARPGVGKRRADANQPPSDARVSIGRHPPANLVRPSTHGRSPGRMSRG